MIDDNEYLKERLKSLCDNDEYTQSDVHQKFYHDLHHYAWWKSHDEHIGADAANDGLNSFFRHCASHKEFVDCTYPLAYLYTCVRNASKKSLIQRFTYTDKMPIHSISSGSQSKITIIDHRLTGQELIKFSRTNSTPNIDGAYGKNKSTFQVVDRDTIEIPFSVEKDGDKGFLHVSRRSRPKNVSFTPTKVDKDSPGWEPQAPTYDTPFIGDLHESPGKLDSKPKPTDEIPDLIYIRELLEKYKNKISDLDSKILMMKAQGNKFEEIGLEIGRSAENVRKTDYKNALANLKKAITDGSSPTCYTLFSVYHFILCFFIPFH